MNEETRNPFSIVKADDFTDQQLEDYWVDLAGGNGFKDILDPTSAMSAILVGGKGSGKTHLMKYFSFPLQKLRHGVNVVDGVINDGFVGVYLKCGGLNSERFSGKSISNDKWNTIFPYYFEIWIARLVVGIAIDLIRDSFSDIDEAKLCKELCGKFDKFPNENPSTLQKLADWLELEQKNIDHKVNNSVFTGDITGVDILSTPGALFFGFPEVICSCLDGFEKVHFLYLIDELENLSFDQQKYIQTLIRDRKKPCSIRAGVRSYGIKTVETYADGEENRDGSEFEYIRLDYQLRQRAFESYKKFAIDLCVKRLEEVKVLKSGVRFNSEDFNDYFENEGNVSELDMPEGIKGGSSGKTIIKLKKKLEDNKQKLIAAGMLHEGDIVKILKLLSITKMPVLEKIGVFVFYQKWNSKKVLLKEAQNIANICRDYIKEPNSQKRFKEIVGKFKLDILAQLRKENSKKQNYSGIDTLIKLSVGFPRCLLTLLKHIYQYSVFNGESPFVEGKISGLSQYEGIRQASEWFFEDARMAGADGAKLKNAIENLAEIFRINRYSDKPSECSLRAFYANVSECSSETRRLINLAVDWSLLLKDSEGRRDKNSERVDDKYELNPMLVPHWGLPVGVRGVLRFNAQMLDAIFEIESEKEFKMLSKEFERARTIPFNIKYKVQENGQGKLDFK